MLAHWFASKKWSLTISQISILTRKAAAKLNNRESYKFLKNAMIPTVSCGRATHLHEILKRQKFLFWTSFNDFVSEQRFSRLKA